MSKFIVALARAFRAARPAAPNQESTMRTFTEPRLVRARETTGSSQVAAQDGNVVNAGTIAAVATGTAGNIAAEPGPPTGTDPPVILAAGNVAGYAAIIQGTPRPFEQVKADLVAAHQRHADLTAQETATAKAKADNVSLIGNLIAEGHAAIASVEKDAKEFLADVEGDVNGVLGWLEKHL